MLFLSNCDALLSDRQKNKIIFATTIRLFGMMNVLNKTKDFFMKKIFLLLNILGLSFLGCSQNQDFDKMVTDLITKEVPLFNPKTDSLSPNTILLDARQKKEYDTSHLEGAQFVSFKEFDLSSIKDIPKDQEIIVYCTVGYRSGKIGEKLQDAGYTNVKNMYGGIFQWVNSGHEVVDNKGKSTEKVHCYNKKWSQWLEVGEKVY